jgi:hypothetical protein
MNHRPIDPHRHAPEVTPDDEWCDSRVFASERPAEGPVLPHRRTVAQQAHGQNDSQNQKHSQGLRIDSGEISDEPTGSSGGLLVEEIGGKVLRLEQAEASPPKVERRITFHAKQVREPTPANERGEGREWGHTKRRSMRWIIGAGAATMGIIILTLLLLPVINAPNAVHADPNFKIVVQEKEMRMEIAEQMNALLPRRNEAERILEAISRAGHVDDVLPFVLGRGGMKEILHKTWRHSVAGVTHGSPSGQEKWEVFTVDQRPYAQLSGSFLNHSNYGSYFTYEGGRLMLDWKATVAFGTASFDELQQGAGDPSEVRGVISATNFYSSQWPETGFRSYRLVSPDQSIAIWCYARRGSAAEAILVPLFEQGAIVQDIETEKKVTLRLESGTDGSGPNQWLIGEILHIDWVTP